MPALLLIALITGFELKVFTPPNVCAPVLTTPRVESPASGTCNVCVEPESVIPTLPATADEEKTNVCAFAVNPFID